MCEKKKNVNFNEASGSEKELNWKTNKGKKISCKEMFSEAALSQG